MHRLKYIQIFVLFMLSGCAVAGTSSAGQPVIANTRSAMSAAGPSTEDNPLERPFETPSAVTITPTLTVISQETFSGTELVEPAIQDPINVQDEVTRSLSTLLPPVRDDLRLAMAYRGLLVGEDELQNTVANTPAVGSRQTFRIMNVVDNTVDEIEAELVVISEHAYFWFDVDPGSPKPELAEIQRIANEFDDVYELVVKQFGTENKPGIDGDPRLHVVNASAMSVCGVTEDTANQCQIAGLVQPADILPHTVDARSNEREMFVMNAHRFGGDFYLGVLAHEFRHMIEDNYDIADTGWEKEGSATLAAQLAGYPSAGDERGNMFLENPDQQLNNWTDGDTGPYYGQGYLLNRYIYDRFGEALYLQFATSPLPGLQAVDYVAEANELDLDGESLWLDWLVALLIHDEPGAAEKYRFESQGIQKAASTLIENTPVVYHESVSQYAADYYTLPNVADELSFSGNTAVSLLGVDPISGERFWFSQRANNSNPRLTREVNLTGVDQATLIYHVYADIERGYDFAYVSVSVDDGQTWIPLIGEHMQGLDPEDNPAGSAFTNRFYTGRRNYWLKEEIDIGAFAGQKILIRFEYVTDPKLTYGGLALDDIAIPEIDFFDDVESADSAWVAEGFLRATPNLSQKWHLQLVTFEEEGPAVQQYEVNPDGKLSLRLDSLDSIRPPVLIVAALTPTTLMPADYMLNIR